MSFFGLANSSDRYGIIIDIGSGSVLSAIVHSKIGLEHTQIIWSHREHTPLRNIDSINQSAKAVMTALFNAAMLLDSEGRKVLYDYNPNSKLTELQCSISAPWSYTVTKTVNYNQEEQFVISEQLILELLQTINEKVNEDLKVNESLQNLGLQIVARSNVKMLSNGYDVINPEGQKAKSLAISNTSVVVQKYLIDTLNEARDKLFPQTECRMLSFILMLNSMSNYLLPGVNNVCLVDITYEATEIGVIRDGSLTYCTHTAFGSFSLAREISAVTAVPIHEAFGYLHSNNPFEFIKSLNKSQADEIELVFEAYVSRVTELFNETGDSLTIPKKISLHSDLDSESTFIDLIGKAAKRSLKSEVDITTISKEIIRQYYNDSDNISEKSIPKDTALLLSAQFFHMNPEHKTFEYF